ncbi:MAG: hypothetical protein LIO55_08115 [Oscillospiraceae bacterium]|nr:hypothetical protein [Oscillospiraceae bacterium]
MKLSVGILKLALIMAGVILKSRMAKTGSSLECNSSTSASCTELSGL